MAHHVPQHVVVYMAPNSDDSAVYKVEEFTAQHTTHGMFTNKMINKHHMVICRMNVVPQYSIHVNQLQDGMLNPGNTIDPDYGFTAEDKHWLRPVLETVFADKKHGVKWYNKTEFDRNTMKFSSAPKHTAAQDWKSIMSSMKAIQTKLNQYIAEHGQASHAAAPVLNQLPVVQPVSNGVRQPYLGRMSR
jgi:hypothetical protein